METVAEDPYSSLLLILETFSANFFFYTINGGILILLLIFSALVSGSEVAFFSFTADDIRLYHNSKNTRLNTIAKLLIEPKKLLATILILNNLTNIAIVTLSTYITWQIVGIENTEGQVIVVLTFIVTLLIVFFGEIVPKVYANQHNLQFAKVTAPLLNFSASVLTPVAWGLMTMSGFIERRVVKKGYNISVEELNQALEITTNEETSEEEKGILRGIVNFGTLTVKQIMRSRLDITAFDINTDFHELMDKINKTGFSRIPVFSETIDKIEGILYIKDLLPYIDDDESFNWQRLMRPGFFVPESKKIDDLLKDFQEKRVHMAIVVDEYGGVSGLVTLEDIIEEIVGEIKDEFDEDEVAYNKIDESTYVFEGKTSLMDFCKITGEDISIFDGVKGESESLGGLLLELNAKLPRAGEKITHNKFLFTVVSVDNKRIKRVRVYIKKSAKEKRIYYYED